MTEDVHFPHKQAVVSQEKTEVTIVSWDYENKRGTAMTSGGQTVEVAQVTTLTIVEQKEGQLA